MTLPCSRSPDHKTENGPLLPFIECIKTENRGKVKANAEIFPASYPGRGLPPSMIGWLLWSTMVLPWPCGSTCSSFKKSMICSGSKNRALYALLFAAFSAKTGTSRSSLCYTVNRLRPLRAAEKSKISSISTNMAGFCVKRSWAIPHNSKCRYGERGAADAKPKAQIILDAAKVSAASGGNSEPKQGQRSQSARGFCPRSTMRVPQPDIIEHFGNADAVPQLPERCLSRKAGIVRCCLR